MVACTHYCKSEAYNTCHMHDSLEPEDLTPTKFDLATATQEQIMDELARKLAEEDVIVVDGLQYQVKGYGPIKQNGDRDAVLTLWSPF